MNKLFTFMLLWSRPQGGGLFVSSNGTDWSEPVATGGTGDRSTIFDNPFRRKWIYSLRSGWSGRARDCSESSDFLDGAPFLDKINWLRVGNLDLPDKHWLYAQPEQKPARGGHTPQLYNFDAVAYESLIGRDAPRRDVRQRVHGNRPLAARRIRLDGCRPRRREPHKGALAVLARQPPFRER
jgi:hypothetical protein